MRLPPLNALRAFEAAARHEGFVGAAEELHVTRGAISRHVKLLEVHLGTRLFRRHARGVELTEAGRAFLPVLTDAFERIRTEARRLSSDANELRVICPPATSIRWLIPRLGNFKEVCPEIRLRLTTDFHGELGFDRSEFDLGFSVENVPGRRSDVELQKLFPMLLTPACAPALLDGGRPLRTPADLAKFTLLHESPDRADWKAWLTRFEVAGVDPESGDVFHNLDVAAKAAAMGAGVVMADLVLCREEIDSGALVTPFPDMRCVSPHGHIAVLGAREKWNEPKVRKFREWLAGAARESTCEVSP